VERRLQAHHPDRLFEALDEEKKGYLDLVGFRDTCSSACRPAAGRAREIFHEMDQAKTGMVTFADFKVYLEGEAST